jgi:glycosyltransferase involved in cell wall biosynthesis
VIVTSSAVADTAVERIGLESERVVVVPLAAGPIAAPSSTGERAELARRLGLPSRYLVVGGRYDARSDLRTVLQALAALRRQEGPDGLPDWPPRLVLVGAGGTASVGRDRVRSLLEHFGVDDLVLGTPPLDEADRAAVEAGAVGHIQPALSDAVGLPALDAVALGVPVVASRTGCLPGIVGQAGIIVEPRDTRRMANALRAIWDDGPVAIGLRRAARERASQQRRTWGDVAADTRAVYREAALEADLEARG